MATRQSPGAGRSGPDGPTSPLGAVTLVTGPEEFLNERVIRAAREAVRRADPEAESSDTVGDQLSMASLGELAAPSLFSSTRLVIVRQIEDAPDDVHDGLVAYAGEPDPDIALVLVHSGGQKGVGLLNRLRKLPSVTEHRSEAVKGAALAQFVTQEARQHGGRLEPDAAALLVEAVGADLRSLAAAADQLSHDFPDGPLTAEVVQPLLLRPRRRQGLRDRRPRPARADRHRAGGAPVGPGDRGHRPGGDRVVRLRGAGPGPDQGSPGRGPRTTTWPARRGPALEGVARCATRPGPGTRTGSATRDPGGGPGRRRGQGRRCGRGVQPRAAWCSPSPERARPAEPDPDPPWTWAPAPDAAKAPPRRGGAFGQAAARRGRQSARQSDAACLAMADLRFAAWFLWMTPAEAALSSLLGRVAPRPPWPSRRRRTRRRPEAADGGLQRGLDGLVALVRAVVLLVALDLGLDVRHGAGLSVSRRRWVVVRRTTEARHTRLTTLSAAPVDPPNRAAGGPRSGPAAALGQPGPAGRRPPAPVHPQ